MKVLVVGGGGREHALCWSLSGSPLVDGLYCAPGNAGIAATATCVGIEADDLDRLVRFAKERGVGLVVVGPERPLVLGLVDRLEAEGVKAFGPTAAAARLEGSKRFMKAFCARHGIPTAPWRAFAADEAGAARAFVAAEPLPLVVKADGLAAGKGVVIAGTRAEALAALDDAFAAGDGVVVERFLAGEEASLFALCDGRDALLIGTAQDHKRAFDGDEGPNTGGMGAYAPAPLLEGDAAERVMDAIVRPTLAAMAAEGAPFKGFLYAGLMLTDEGPQLLEYNVRFGDPECQAVLPRLMTDLAQLLQGAVDGMLGHMDLRWYPEHALTVVLAAKGYPGTYPKDTPIGALEGIDDDPDVLLFHAGTRREDGRLLSTGGRVLSVTGLGATLKEARARAYAAVERIDWPDGFYRRDIGWRALRAG
ncbi:MAG: phosphoribosylamine--glycine ligase [Geminicoccaceae bacterium]|nr:phosphoribosylamine--glycine ligase [Geminicoccaceae bacterium]